MDGLIGSYGLYRKYIVGDAAKKEEFRGGERDVRASGAAGVIIMTVNLMIGSFAVYLSWSCNTAAGTGTGLKIFFAFFAFLFGFLYLIFYAIFRAGRCAPTVVYVTVPPVPPVAPEVAPVQAATPEVAMEQPPARGGRRKGVFRKKK